MQQGQRKTLLFLPGTLWFRTVGDTRRCAAEWITAIRETVKAATGNDLCCRTDQVTVIPASPWGTLLLYVSVLVTTVILLSPSLHLANSRQLPPITVPVRPVPRMVLPHKEPWEADFLKIRKPRTSAKHEN
jgi:hypothetical protein